MTRPTIGFVGLGRMGAPIAANVARAGYPLVVFNRDATKAARFAQDVPCTVAADVVDLASRSDIVVTMVTDGPALAELLLREDVLDGLNGKIVVDMSTIGPEDALAISSSLSARGVRFVESPVSGSTLAATNATLTLLVGAEPRDFATVEPLLAHLGKEIRHLGPPGKAALIKVAINSLVLGLNQCLAEALVLAERGGVDRVTAYDTFLSSAAASPAMIYRQALFLEPHDAEISFTVDLAEKDLRLAAGLAEGLGLAMPQLAANLEALRAAIAGGYGQADVSAVAEHLRTAPEAVSG